MSKIETTDQADGFRDESITDIEQRAGDDAFRSVMPVRFEVTAAGVEALRESSGICYDGRALDEEG